MGWIKDILSSRKCRTYMSTKRSSPDSDVIRYVITITGLCRISYWYQFRSSVPVFVLGKIHVFLNFNILLCRLPRPHPNYYLKLNFLSKNLKFYYVNQCVPRRQKSEHWRKWASVEESWYILEYKAPLISVGTNFLQHSPFCRPPASHLMPLHIFLYFIRLPLTRSLISIHNSKPCANHNNNTLLRKKQHCVYLACCLLWTVNRPNIYMVLLVFSILQ